MIISVSFLHLDLISLATRAINVSMDNLKTLTTKELQSKWQEIFKIPAPKGYTKSFLIKEIEWYYKYRKLSGELQKRLDKLVEHYSETKTIDTKKIKKFEVTIGTKFIREFKGEKMKLSQSMEGLFLMVNYTNPFRCCKCNNRHTLEW